mgnify:CR=1 FL=1
MLKIRIGLVDDHVILRTGLRKFIEESSDLVVVGEAGSGREAIDLARNQDMDVMLMDISMPGQSGIDALAMIRAKAPDLGILILSGYPEEHYAVSLIRQGASGYLNKQCDPDEIVAAIRRPQWLPRQQVHRQPLVRLAVIEESHPRAQCLHRVLNEGDMLGRGTPPRRMKDEIEDPLLHRNQIERRRPEPEHLAEMDDLAGTIAFHLNQLAELNDIRLNLLGIANAVGSTIVEVDGSTNSPGFAGPRQSRG